MLQKSARGAVASALLCLSTGAALAHITLENQTAPIGSTYKAVMRVGHGCEGSPTLKVRVRIPEGVIAVKPMPKPGWDLDTVEGAYKQPYDYYGTPMTDGRARDRLDRRGCSTSTTTSSSSAPT